MSEEITHNEFEETEETVAVTGIEIEEETPIPVSEEGVDDEDEEEENWGDLSDDLDDFDLPDGARSVIVRIPGRPAIYAPVPSDLPGLIVQEVIQNTSLLLSGVVEFWLDGAKVDYNTLIPSGRTLTIVGSAKGA